MKSFIAWATCVLLLLGQLIFFYTIVSPQLQKKPDPPQHLITICDNSSDLVENKIGMLQNGMLDNQANPSQYNRIEQISFAPSQGSQVCAIVIYSAVSQ